MKFNWNQSGMPASLVSQVGKRSALSEFKSVLRDAQDHIMSPVDAEAMAKELVESGGREYVEMVRDLSVALASVKRERDDANRRYERLVADLKRRCIRINEDRPPHSENPVSPPESPAPAEGLDEWDEWNRKFQSLLG